MPNISLSDGVTLLFDVPSTASLARYVKLPKIDLALAASDLVSQIHSTLDTTHFEQLGTALKVNQPVPLKDADTQLTIEAGLKAQLAVHAKEGDVLLDQELWGDPIRVPVDMAYVSTGFEATVGAAVNRGAGDLMFGFKAGTTVRLDSCRLFPASDTKFVDAVRETFASFTLPSDLEDLSEMPLDAVASVSGEGRLKVSGDFSLSAVPSPLVLPAIAPGLEDIGIHASSGLTVGASCELKGTYQVRVQKIAENRVGLGYFRSKRSQVEVTVAAEAGVTVGMGSSDWLSMLLGAVSSDPAAAGEAMDSVKLSSGAQKSISAAVQASVERSLKLSLEFAFSDSREQDGAFLYEIDLEKLTEKGSKAVRDALHGDLSGLTSDEEQLAAQGIRLQRSVLKNLRERSIRWKLNLLGIYNYVSITKMLREGTVLHDPLSGELVITDKATATRIKSSSINIGADSEKLRRVLYECMIPTATIRAMRDTAALKLGTTHTYYEFKNSASPAALKDNLDAVEALGLIKAAEKIELVGRAAGFSRCSFVLEATYDDTLCSRLFLTEEDSGLPQARPVADFEQAGREAILLLVQRGEADDYRRQPMEDDGLWARMKTAGPANIRLVLPDDLAGNPARVGAITSDYLTIVWWAETMHRMGEQIVAMREFLARPGGLDPKQKEFTKRRKDLADALAKVASQTKEQFGDPWGLVAMYLAAGRQAPVRSQVMSRELAFSEESARVLVQRP